jgi:rhodanese-related sulfurtransferase
VAVRGITVREASDLAAKEPGMVLLDVRTPEEYGGELGHLAGAILIPLHDLPARIGELDDRRGSRILVYCRTGRRSLVASEMLVKRGHDAVNVEGGIVAWNEQKLPGVEHRG